MRKIKILILGFCVFLLSFQTAKAGREHNVSGWAWSENIGWISFNNTSDGSSINYGVHIDPSTGKFSGYAWSANIGWISFNRAETGAPPSNDPCPDGSCIAKVEKLTDIGKSNVKVLGWARVLSVKDNPNAGGWDGWIRFDHGREGEVYIDKDGNFHGWAWTDMVVGWISFNSSDPGAGGSAYKVVLDLVSFPPTASFQCDASLCPGGSCNGTWIMYHAVAKPASCACIFRIKNTSTDPGNDIVKSEWYLNNQLKLSCNGICDYTPQRDVLPGNYTLKLKVIDSVGNFSEITRPLTVKREVRADFMCSTDGVNWKECSKISLTQGEIIYVKDDPSVPNHSIPSEGATKIVKRVWQKGDGNNFVTFAQNTNFATTTLTTQQKVLRLNVTDDNNRCDQQDYSLSVAYPLPRWKEIPPFIWFKKFLAAISAGIGGILR